MLKNLALVLSLILAGCSGIEAGKAHQVGYEEPYAASLVERFSDPANLTAENERERNQILSALVWLTDYRYAAFETQLWAASGVFHSALDLAQLGLAATGVLHHAEATKSVVAAVSGGLVGARASISKNFLEEQARSALIATMRVGRHRKLEQIRVFMALSMEEYPLERGLVDIREYAERGTIVSALQAIVATAVETDR